MQDGANPAVTRNGAAEPCAAAGHNAVLQGVAIPGGADRRQWKFSELLADPSVRARWEKVRKYFFLRESTYDMSNRCNLRCDGCYYYEGEKQFAGENGDSGAWRTLMRAEKARGITYVVLAGAEPSLVSGLLEVCFAEMPLGCIATNGVRRIEPAMPTSPAISSPPTTMAIINSIRVKPSLFRKATSYLLKTSGNRASTRPAS